MKLKIITPTEITFSGQANQVNLPGELGEMTILPGHTHVVSTLIKGKLEVQSEKAGTQCFVVGAGIAEVGDNIITVLVQNAKAQ